MSSAPFWSTKIVSLISVIVVMTMITSSFIGLDAGNHNADRVLSGSLPEPLSSPSDANAVSDDNAEYSMRGSRSSLIITDGNTSEIIGKTVSYTNIWIHESTLRIENSKVTVEPVTTGEPARFTVLGASANLEIVNSELFVRWGHLEVDCKNLTITNSKIHATNKTTHTFVDGHPSKIILKAQEQITIKNSDILSEADYGDPDGLGGNGELNVESANGVSIYGTGSGISVGSKTVKGLLSLGGEGSAETARRSSSRFGRAGGESRLGITAGGAVNIQDTNVIAQGGDGGYPDSSGGHTYFTLDAGSHPVSFIRARVGANGGLDGNDKTGQRAGKGETKITSGIFLLDEPNKESTRNNPLTTIYGSTIHITAPSRCELYNPNSESTRDETNIATLDDSTEISIFFWLKVYIKDNSGNKLGDATVTISDKSDHEIAVSPTGNDGLAVFPPIEAYTITKVNQDGKNLLKITASKYNTKTVDPTYFLYESSTIEMIITLLTITVTSVGDKALPPTNLMEVGCTVEILGTCDLPEGAGSIDTVTVKVDDDKLISPGPEDISNDGDWTQWKLIWNSVSVKDGVHKLTFEVKIGTSLSDTYVLNVTVNQRSCNHAPEILNVSTPADNENIKDSEEMPWYIIKGTAFDEDWDSELSAEEGAAIEKVNIKITGGSENINYDILSDFMGYDELTGIYSWSYQWNTRKTDAGFFVFPNGKYNITISVRDKANFMSESWGTKKLTVELYHLVTPTAIIYDVNGNRIEDHSVDIPIETKNKKLNVAFNANQSYDFDDPDGNLQYFWNFGDEQNSGWIDNPKTSHDYIIDEKFERYTVQLKVRDKDNLESKNKGNNEVTLKINFIEPAPPMDGPLATDSFKLGLNDNDSMFYVFIIIIIILNVVGAFYILFTNRRITKQRESQRAMMEKQRRELAAEIAKERAASGYGDFTDEYMIPVAQQKKAVSQAVDGTVHGGGTAVPAAAPKPAAPAPAPKPQLPEGGQPAVPPAPAASQPTPPPPATPQMPQVPQVPPPAKPPAPSQPSPPQTVQQHPQPQKPPAQPSTAQTPAQPQPQQMVACPTCSAQIAVNTTPCPSCGTHLNWK